MRTSVMLAALFLCTRAAAQEDPQVTRARALFVEGTAHANEMRWGEALARFESAQKLHPHPGTVYNIGICQRALGRYAQARASFRRALDEHRATTVLADGTVANIEGYLRDTAESYAKAVDLIASAGSPTFLELSRALYGDPFERLPGTSVTHFEAAQQLLDITAPWAAACRGEEQLSCMTAEHVRSELQARVDPFFTEHPITVVIDSRLTSKAAAERIMPSQPR